MSVLKKVGLALAALIVALLLIGLVLPSSATVERSAVIKAPPCNVYAVVNSYRMFNRWSPWAKMDPNTIFTNEGPAEGVGASQGWESTVTGKGKQTITDSKPCELVEQELAFEGQPPAVAFFRLEPDAEGTKLTWGFTAEFGMNLPGRFMGLGFDSMMGGDFEQGLADLGALMETLPKTDVAGLDAELVEVPPRPWVYVSTQSGRDPQAVGVAMGVAMGQIQGFVAANGLALTGPPLAVNTAEGADVFIFDVGQPIDALPAAPPVDGPVKVGQTPSGKAVKAVAIGPYGKLGETYGRTLAWMGLRGLEQAGPSWEVYVSDPTSTPPDQLVTHVFYPVK